MLPFGSGDPSGADTWPVRKSTGSDRSSTCIGMTYCLKEGSCFKLKRTGGKGNHDKIEEGADGQCGVGGAARRHGRIGASFHTSSESEVFAERARQRQGPEGRQRQGQRQGKGKARFEGSKLLQGPGRLRNYQM